jgi:hypothetical protein
VKQGLFSAKERAEVARLFGLNGADAAKNVLATEEILAEWRARRAREEAEIEDELKRLKFVRPRGRPGGREYQAMGELIFLSRMYVGITGRPIRNSTSHPFYRLAQIFLRRADPGPLIASLKRPPWSQLPGNVGRP